MFETLIFQYLNKLVEGEVRDFASPEPFHTLKVERLGGDKVKPSAEVRGKFPMPIAPLVRYASIEPCQLSEGTPPIVRAFNFTQKPFVEVSEFVQGLFQELWTLYLLTGVECEKSVFQTEVCTYTFTRSAQDLLSGIICHDIKPIRANTVAKDLEIADVSLPMAVLVKREPTFIKLQTLRGRIPRLQRKAHTSIFKFMARLELRRTVASFTFELGFTRAFYIQEPLPSDVQADNHCVKRITRNPSPMLFSPFEKVCQMRLQAKTTGVSAIPTVIPIFQLQKVVMDIAKVIQQIAQAFILGMCAYLIFVCSHSVTSYQSLTPSKWVGRHVALRQRLECLPTGKHIIAFFDTFCQEKKHERAVFPP